MRIAFGRVVPQPMPVRAESLGVVFEGALFRRSDGFAIAKGGMQGMLEVACDHCGESFLIPIEEPLELVLSDTLYTPPSEEESEFVIECLDGQIDLEELLQGELEAIRSDYHQCESCTHLNEGDEDGST